MPESLIQVQQKPSTFFIRVHNEPLSVAAMRVCACCPFEKVKDRLKLPMPVVPERIVAVVHFAPTYSGAFTKTVSTAFVDQDHSAPQQRAQHIDVSLAWAWKGQQEEKLPLRRHGG